MRAQISYHDEIIVDNFAGGGGTSTGIELATGRPVFAAINHDPDAVLMHKTNHPYTRHYCESVWDVDPREICQGHPVGLAWFSPDCFAPGTMILTHQGYKPIESVEIGDMVLTHKKRWRKVTATMVSERDEMIVRGYGNPKIVCSTGHPFLVKTRSKVYRNKKKNYVYTQPTWKKAKDLNDKDYWGIPTQVQPLPIPEPDNPNNKALKLPVDERLMYLAGRYVSDGWTQATATGAEVTIVCDRDEIDFLEQKLDMWNRKDGCSKDHELTWHFQRVRTRGQFTANSTALAKWLRDNFNYSAIGKRIPGWLFGTPIAFRKAFLDGYLGSHGWNERNLHECNTVSKSLAFGMKSLIATMGYSPMVYISEYQNKIKRESTNAKPIYTVKWRNEVAADRHQTFTEDDILWTPIREAVETGRRSTFYNISVEEDESYVAEGIIVHNCKHFSKAKGGKPVDKNIRGLAWVTLRWAALVRPRVIILENVEEFQTWGPIKRHKPDKKRAGQTFQKFISQLRNLDYDVEWRELVAADYGAPTIRRRFFLIARCDGRPIIWPEPTHAPKDSEEVKNGIRKPWRSAAEIIDWSLPCPSIFDSKENIKEKYGVKAQRPLRPNTMKRAICGVDKFVIKADTPFIIQVNHAGAFRGQSIDEPIQTITAKHGYGIVNPVLSPVTVTNTSNSAGAPADFPVHTTTPTLTPIALNANSRKASNTSFEQEHRLIGASLLQYHTEQHNETTRGQSLMTPLCTIDAANRYGLVGVNLMKLKGKEIGSPIDNPLPTITAGGLHHAQVVTTIARAIPGADLGHWPHVRDLLNKHCGYNIGPNEVLLLSIGDHWYFICDIGLRMLTPRELYAANGFPSDYIIDRDYAGNVYHKNKQVARCGNAVPPPFATALVRANLPEWCKEKFTTMKQFHDAVAV